nr:Oxoglutarate/iron-dependent dioxygenase [Ipomoea batatas]
MESSFPTSPSLPPFTRSPHSHLPLITTFPAIFSRHRQIAPSLSTITASYSSQSPLLSARTVSISYTELKDKNADLSSKIEEGFGVNGLGLLSISDVPEYSLLRKNLLHLSTRYSFGWSYGKEKQDGKLDKLKASFFANPILDVPTTEPSNIQRLNSATFWLRCFIPFKDHQGVFVSSLGLVIVKPSSSALDDGSVSSWSWWHTDYASLTGLTCEMFTRDDVEIPCPDNAAGLYIMSRTGQVVKPEYGEDEIAYLVGETGEILSRHLLCATPHCVRAPKGVEASSVGRSTYVLFMQPNWDEKFNFSEMAHIHEELRHSNHPLTYGEYSERLHDKHY